MCNDVDVLVGRRLRRRRRLLGMTQLDLALAAGVSFQQIQKYECAYNRLSVAMLWKLACVLGVDVGYFFVDVPATAAALPARRADLRAAAAPAQDRDQAA